MIGSIFDIVSGVNCEKSQGYSIDVELLIQAQLFGNIRPRPCNLSLQHGKQRTILSLCGRVCVCHIQAYMKSTLKKKKEKKKQKRRMLPSFVQCSICLIGNPQECYPKHPYAEVKHSHINSPFHHTHTHTHTQGEREKRESVCVCGGQNVLDVWSTSHRDPEFICFDWICFSSSLREGYVNTETQKPYLSFLSFSSNSCIIRVSSCFFIVNFPNG